MVSPHALPQWHLLEVVVVAAVVAAALVAFEVVLRPNFGKPAMLGQHKFRTNGSNT